VQELCAHYPSISEENKKLKSLNFSNSSQTQISSSISSSGSSNSDVSKTKDIAKANLATSKPLVHINGKPYLFSGSFFILPFSFKTKQQTKTKIWRKDNPLPGRNIGQISARSVQGFWREGYFTTFIVDKHTMRYTGPVSVVSQCKNWCLAEGLRKRRSAPPYGP